MKKEVICCSLLIFLLQRMAAEPKNRGSNVSRKREMRGASPLSLPWLATPQQPCMNSPTHTALMCFVFNKAVLCTPIKLEKNVGCDRNARSSFHGLNLVISSHSGKLWCLTKEKTQPFREYQYEWSKKMVVYIQSQWALFSRCVSVTRLFDSAKISGKKSAKLGSNSLVWLQPYQSWTDHVMVNKLYI